MEERLQAMVGCTLTPLPPLKELVATALAKLHALW